MNITPPPQHQADNDSKISMFGAKRRAKELTAEVSQLRADMARLGTLELTELAARRDALRQEVGEQQRRLASDLSEHVATLEATTQQALRAERESLRQDMEQVEQLRGVLKQLHEEVVLTTEIAMLQEAGIYEYRHPLTNATEYREQLTELQAQIKEAVRDGEAIKAATGWTVNGSTSEGKRMVSDFSKLMLRAYNAEADNLVRGLKPYKLEASIDRLVKVSKTIERLGRTMSIEVQPTYHRLRVMELRMTADYLAKVAAEKDEEREERGRLREERKAQQEIAAERLRLEKERQHYLNAVRALDANGDVEGAGRLRDQLGDIAKAIEDVDYRAANVRAGYVYVISNVGAFGDRMIKVGLTRRLEPMDRVRELGDASVPFKFDVHALFFSKDAVGIESSMHAALADRRVNRVNLRREFFYATPAEARGHLVALTGDLLQFEELPEAVEYHQSSSDGAPALVS